MTRFAQNFYERYTGEKHEVTILSDPRDRYEVRVDGEFYADHDSKAAAFDEVIDIVRVNLWSTVSPF